MAIRERDLLKSWFRTGMYPTEEQFADFMDSYIHKLDSINFEDISGLDEYINARNEALAAAINEFVANALQSAKDYADEQDAAVVQEAKDYTNEKITEIQLSEHYQGQMDYVAMATGTLPVAAAGLKALVTGENKIYTSDGAVWGDPVEITPQAGWYFYALCLTDYSNHAGNITYDAGGAKWDFAPDNYNEIDDDTIVRDPITQVIKINDDMAALLRFMLAVQNLSSVVNIPATSANTNINISADATLSLYNVNDLKPGYEMVIIVTNNQNTTVNVTLPYTGAYRNDYAMGFVSIPPSDRKEISLRCYAPGSVSIRVSD
ncbi:hypothetical protein [Dysgonomonas termitidis]|uniref:Uncharacterized protein n=1 Tax=Dysgonomonas termitidis TaxID=1516126 RepID=A0ABV9KYU9_9BACT